MLVAPLAITLWRQRRGAGRAVAAGLSQFSGCGGIFFGQTFENESEKACSAAGAEFPAELLPAASADANLPDMTGKPGEFRRGQTQGSAPRSNGKTPDFIDESGWIAKNVSVRAVSLGPCPGACHLQAAGRANQPDTALAQVELFVLAGGNGSVLSFLYRLLEQKRQVRCVPGRLLVHGTDHSRERPLCATRFLCR